MKLLLLLLIMPPLAHGNGHDNLGRARRQVTPTLSITNLSVVTIEYAPYVYYNESTNKFTGFLVDYVEAVAKRLGIDYYMYLVPDGRWGAFNPATGKWSGIMGELTKMESGGAEGAHIGAAPLIITKNREGYVNFVHPFQHISLSILVRKPYSSTFLGEDKWSQHFQVLYPLAPEVWGFICLAYIVVSGLLYLMNKFNPYEWSTRHEIGRADAEHAATFSISGSLWYAFTTSQWQGYERSPRSISSKLLSAFWFAFVTLTMLTYTGGVVNQLFWSSTVHGKVVNAAPFSTMEELIVNKDYKYGTGAWGQTIRYVTLTARGEEFKRMKAYWETDEGKKQLVNNQEEALQRVLTEKYAYIDENMVVRHIVNQNCDVMEIKTDVAKNHYGLSVYKSMDKDLFEALHSVNIQLILEGEVEAMEKYWWYDRGLCWNITKAESLQQSVSRLELNKPARVDLEMFWGPLLLLLLGVIISVLVLVAEALFYKFKGKYDPENRPRSRDLKLDDGTTSTTSSHAVDP